MKAEVSNMKREKNKIVRSSKRSRWFWGIAVSVYSILYGLFYVIYKGYMISHAQPFMSFLPETLIGMLLIMFGLLKITGIVTDNRVIRLIGIVGLSAIWGGMLFITTSYSFGLGYPDPSFIDKLFVWTACLRISLKGTKHLTNG